MIILACLYAPISIFYFNIRTSGGSYYGSGNYRQTKRLQEKLTCNSTVRGGPHVRRPTMRTCRTSVMERNIEEVVFYILSKTTWRRRNTSIPTITDYCVCREDRWEPGNNGSYTTCIVPRRLVVQGWTPTVEVNPQKTCEQRYCRWMCGWCVEDIVDFCQNSINKQLSATPFFFSFFFTSTKPTVFRRRFLLPNKAAFV